MPIKEEKVYITRDEGDDYIYIWRKPNRGNWSPSKLKDCDVVNWQREDIDNMDVYTLSDFKKKFNITIKSKQKQCCHIPYKLIHNEDYKLFSDNPNRKK